MALTDGPASARRASYRPANIDLRTPSPARMYDYYLSGKDNFPRDREAAERALKVFPAGRDLAWANRRFMVSAVKFLARKGIDQFIDIGTGIPTSPNVHEVARSVNPAANVAYVDNDPVVLAHDRALLAGGMPRTAGHRRCRREGELTRMRIRQSRDIAGRKC